MPTHNSWDEALGMDRAGNSIVNKLADSVEGSDLADKDYVPEASYNRDEVIEAAKNDVNFLAALCMPLIFTLLFPSIFISIWQLLLQYVHKTRDFSKLAIGLPRGFGKTTFIKIFIIYCILFTKKRFILVVCSTAQLAENVIADVCDILSEGNILKLFGDWKVGADKNTQEIKKFSFRGRNIILYALGSEGSIRGVNLKFERPDVMIFEDIQTRECADSKVQSDSLERWMIGTAMKAKSPSGCLYIFVANMYPTDCSILKKLKANPTWTKFIVGGILQDGKSLWEDLQPLQQLLEELDHDIAMGHPEIFFSEVLNDETAGVNSHVDFTTFKEWPYMEGDIPQGKFIILDPSTDKRSSDLVTISLFEVYDGKPALVELQEGRYSPGDTIRHTLLIALRAKCSCIGVESTAYQYSLLYWFTQVCAQIGITGIELCELYTTTQSKNFRIRDGIKDIQAGEIHIHPSVRSKVIHQAAHWNPLRKDNTDGILDVIGYSQKMMELYGHLMSTEGQLLNVEYESSRTLKYNSPF